MSKKSTTPVQEEGKMTIELKIIHARNLHNQNFNNKISSFISFVITSAKENASEKRKSTKISQVMKSFHPQAEVEDEEDMFNHNGEEEEEPNVVQSSSILAKLHKASLQKYQTKTVKNTNDPNFNEKFTLEVEVGSRIDFTSINKKAGFNETLGTYSWEVPEMFDNQPKYFILKDLYGGTLTIKVKTLSGGKDIILTDNVEFDQKMTLKLKLDDILSLFIEQSKKEELFRIAKCFILEVSCGGIDQRCDLSMIFERYFNNFHVTKKHQKTFYLTGKCEDIISIKVLCKKDQNSENEEIIGKNKYHIVDFLENERIMLQMNVACYSIMKLELKCVESIYRNIKKESLPIIEREDAKEIVCCMYIHMFPQVDDIMKMVEENKVVFIQTQSAHQDRIDTLLDLQSKSDFIDQSFYSSYPLRIVSHSTGLCKMKFINVDEADLKQSHEQPSYLSLHPVKAKKAKTKKALRKGPNTGHRTTSKDKTNGATPTILTREQSQILASLSNINKSFTTSGIMKTTHSNDYSIVEPSVARYVRKKGNIFNKLEFHFPSTVTYNNIEIIHVETDDDDKIMVLTMVRERLFTISYIEQHPDVIEEVYSILGNNPVNFQKYSY